MGLTAGSMRPEMIVRGFFGPALLLLAYLLALAILLPEGVNRSFVFVTTLTLTAVMLVAYGLLVRARRASRSEPKATEPAAATSERVHRTDALLLLLPLTPVVQYVLLNRDILTLTEAFLLIGGLGVVALVVVLVVPLLLGRVMSVSVTMFIGLGLMFMLYNMAALARSQSWHRAGDPLILLGLFGLIVVGGVALYRRQRSGAYLIAGLYFLATVGALLLVDPEATVTAASSTRAGSEARPQALSTIAGIEPSSTPDILLLTYDGYVENETMLQYGIDNSAQEAWLQSQGFELHPGTYSVAASSVESMGRLLGGITPAQGVAGDSPYLDVLRDAGYKTHGIFKGDYFFRTTVPAYDSSWPDRVPNHLTMLRAILEGEFRNVFDGRDEWPLAIAATLVSGGVGDEFRETKRAVLRSETDEPIFLYTHTGPGHSQYSGRCLDDETERFEQRLHGANAEMRHDIEVILENRPDAIIIVNGDHGPYLSQNCVGMHASDYEPGDVTRLDIQGRVGTFLAIRWPEGMPAERPDIKILQDVMPAVLGSLYPDLDTESLRAPARLAPGQAEAWIAGVDVVDGRIVGGDLDGLPLFSGDD